MNVVVLISGRGSNLEALLEHQNGYQIKHVISNNPKARGLKIARQYGIKNTYLRWLDKHSAEEKLANMMLDIQPDLVVLAGFMRILSPSLVKIFPDKIINIHPSLLPKYPGLNTHSKAILNGDNYHGASVHMVDEKLDNGHILSQTRVRIESDDDAESLASKLILKEHKLLTTTIGLIASGELSLINQPQEKHNASCPNPILIE